MFYDSTYPGKVGINEESPDEALHVIGTAKVDSIFELVPLDDAPTTTGWGAPEEGRMYFNSDDHKLYIWTHDGYSWDWRAVDFE